MLSAVKKKQPLTKEKDMFDYTKELLANIEDHMAQATENDDIELMGELAETMRQTLLGLYDTMEVMGIQSTEKLPSGRDYKLLVVDAKDVDKHVKDAVVSIGERPTCHFETYRKTLETPAEACENEVEFGEEYCEEHK